MDDYLANVRDKYYNEGGMRVINLKEIVVKGHKISQENENKSIYSSVMNYSIDSEDIERTNANSVYDLLGTIPECNEAEIKYAYGEIIVPLSLLSMMSCMMLL